MNVTTLEPVPTAATFNARVAADAEVRAVVLPSADPDFFVARASPDVRDGFGGC